MPKQGEKAGCKECLYYEPKGSDDHPECHLHPPTVVVQGVGAAGQVDIINSAFPGVRPDSWCNDWRQNTVPS